MEKFMIIGERIHCIAPPIRKAIAERDPEPILKRAIEQLDAGAHVIDFNIGPAERDGAEIMEWGVQLLQSKLNNVPLALDTANVAALEAGLKVYDRTHGKPIINSADAGGRKHLMELARKKIIEENKDIKERRKKIKALIDLSVEELKEKI